MRGAEIDAWARTVVRRVKSGSTGEDAFVELKSELPVPDRVARQLAGHANSALGQPILWLIGVDQKKMQLTDVEADLAGWWPQVSKHFNGSPPQLTDHVVEIDGRDVLALCFETTGLPFVVRSQSDHLEVPWREGTRTRSATRGELVSMLLPTVELPEFEILQAELRITRSHGQSSPFEVKASATIYVVPQRETRLVFPFHRAACMARSRELTVDLPVVGLNAPISPAAANQGFGTLSTTILGSASEVIVDGPGSFVFRAALAVQHAPDFGDEATLEFAITPAGGRASALLKAAVTRKKATGQDVSLYR